MDKVNITVIGAGVIGLAVAAKLSKDFKDILVIEKNSSFGGETSSRNSEVIHAGMYYPKDSLKRITCVEGRALLYDYCQKYAVPHKKIGKLIVATNNDETAELEAIFKNGLNNGIDDLVFLSAKETKTFEPYVKAQAAVYSPSTGIIDSHGLMKTLVSQFKDYSGNIVYASEVCGIEKQGNCFKVAVKDSSGEPFSFLSGIVINCAGLYSDKVAELAGIKKDEYKIKFCKGDYCRVNQSKAKFINRLVYPIPKKKGAGLGIHATLDLAGSLRLGPDDEYIEHLDYTVQASKQKLFYESVCQFLLFLQPEDLTADMAGIRPKLQGKGEAFRDFVIKDEFDNGLSGFINLIGIESPGLTASLSIASKVKEIVENLI